MSNMDKNDIVHGKGYSLNQKVMFARHIGAETITIHLDDAEMLLESNRTLDKWLARLMDYAPEDVLVEMCKEIGIDED